MGSLDVPEALIAVSILALLMWAAYNWTHRDVGGHK